MISSIVLVSRLSHLCKKTSYRKFFINTLFSSNAATYNFLICQRGLFREAYHYFFPTSKYMRLQDKVPPDYKLIYIGSSANYVINGYRGILSTSVIGTLFVGISGLLGPLWVLQIYQYAEYYHYILVTSYVVINLLCVHLIARHYAFRIYYNAEKDTYLAVLMNKHPFALKKIEMESKSLVQVKPSGVYNLFSLNRHMYKTLSNEMIYFHFANFENMAYYTNLVKESEYR